MYFKLCKFYWSKQTSRNNLSEKYNLKYSIHCLKHLVQFIEINERQKQSSNMLHLAYTTL